MLTSDRLLDLVARSGLVFRGRVVELRAAGLKVIRDTSATALVGVERVFRGPADIDLKEQKQVTVLLTDPGSVHEGDELVFFATGWMYGDRIAVREVAHLDFDPGRDDAFAREVARAEKAIADAELVARVAAAELVVLAGVGRVLDERFTSGPPSVERVLPPGFDDVVWQPIELSVVNVLKGQARAKRATALVRIEEDPPWRKAPSIAKGRKLILLLRRTRDQKQAGWFAPERGDIRPARELRRIERAIKEAGR